MQSIEELKQKIKGGLSAMLGDWGVFVIVFLIALSSFGLGRLSGLEHVRPPVAILQTAVGDKPRAMTIGGLVVASRSGSAYYFPWCAGALKILPQNQLWFTSEEKALRAGYVPAKNCKGLNSN